MGKWLKKIFVLWGVFTLIYCIPIKVVGEETIIIAIDPGHGGYDGGAEGNHSVEKEINLAVALYLRNYFEQVGFDVFLTRDKDEAFNQGRGSKKRTDLNERIKMVNEIEADLFISIHMNAMPNPRWRGAQSFYHPGKPENKRIAETIQASLKSVLQNTTREAKAMKSIYILKHINMPGVLIESGFLSNPEEEQLLLDSNYQQKLAYAIYLGVLDYLSNE